MNQLIEKQIGCPYCGESIDILVDNSVSEQSYIEDCQVCCRPIQISILIDDDDQLLVRVAHEDE